MNGRMDIKVENGRMDGCRGGMDGCRDMNTMKELGKKGIKYNLWYQNI